MRIESEECVFMAAEFKRKNLTKQKKSRGKTFRKDISHQGINKTNQNRQRIKSEQLLRVSWLFLRFQITNITYTISFSVTVCSYIRKFPERIAKTGEAGKAKLFVSSGTPLS